MTDTHTHALNQRSYEASKSQNKRNLLEIVEDTQKPEFRPPLLQLIVYNIVVFVLFSSILLYIYSYFYVIFFLLRHKCILY